MDSFDVYNENGTKAYIVKKKAGFGTKYEVTDGEGKHVGYIKKKTFSFPGSSYDVLKDEKTLVGTIKHKVALIGEKYEMKEPHYLAKGDFKSWSFEILKDDKTVGTITRSVSVSDTYEILTEEEHAFTFLAFVIVIDAERAEADKNKKNN